MKYMSKNTEKEVNSLKSQFVSSLIDDICNDGNNLKDILKMMSVVSLSSICIKLLAYFIQATSVEDYRSAHQLKKEIIQFIDICD